VFEDTKDRSRFPLGAAFGVALGATFGVAFALPFSWPSEKDRRCRLLEKRD
jgi:hypothetical protein